MVSTAAGDGALRQQPGDAPDAVHCPVCGALVALNDIDSHEAAHDLEMQQQVA